MKGLLKAECVYCGQEGRLFGKQCFHPYVKSHGPFDLYICSSCSSLFTFPLPSAESLGSLYLGFSHGMSGNITALRTRYPMKQWYGLCCDHMLQHSEAWKPDFHWLDVGAGDGVMSELVKERYAESRGTAMDFHNRPSRLEAVDVDWKKQDINTGLGAGESYDLVYAITVLEHVMEPSGFIGNALDLLNERGVLYLNCPRTDAMAFKMLGKKWPYFLPGEHITIPSMKGLIALAQRLFAQRPDKKFSLDIRPVTMPYPLGYYIGFLTGNRWMPDWQYPVHLPTGLLECTIQRLR